jgi:hypothetical protein
MGRRLYSRQSSGRFRRATLENTFGLSAPVCPECRRLNPHGVYEPEPVNCHACGALLAEVSTCRACNQPITMLGGDWTDPDGGTCCYMDLSAPYVPHKPAGADVSIKER